MVQSRLALWLLVASFVIRPPNASAFALLGPPAPWMQATNNVVGAIGGPMDLNSGYRWNVPVITYGFDQSFVDYFGSNGVMAVEGAIQILNDLQPASQLQPTNYPDDTCYMNYAAQAQGLFDLKSKTLSLLMSQLGLADPVYYTYVLKQWSPEFVATESPPNTSPNAGSWASWAYPDYIGMLNFDPVTLQPSIYVNGNFYAAVLHTRRDENYMEIFEADPLAVFDTALASESTLSAGAYCTGLTYDDVGGLAYLFSTNNINYETLPPGVSGAGTNMFSWINGAWRPGIDKLNIIPQIMSSGTGTFAPMTNFFVDTYITNGQKTCQQLERVTTQPDILFSAADFFAGTINSSQISYETSGTTNWINNSALNGNPGGEGPGVIIPPVKITFGKTGLQMYTFGDSGDETAINGITGLYYSYMNVFGTFDGSTNAPISYPVVPANEGTNQMILRMWLNMSQSGQVNAGGNVLTWSLSSQYGATYSLQTSSDLVSWVALYLVTNNGSISTCYVNSPQSTHRFYRLTQM